MCATQVCQCVVRMCAHVLYKCFFMCYANVTLPSVLVPLQTRYRVFGGR